VKRPDSDPTRPRVVLGANPAVRRLSEREREVALLIAQGLKDTVIAHRLGLSASTIGAYVRHIRQRLDLDNRAGIAAWVTARLDPNDPTCRLRRADPARTAGPDAAVLAS
jgi:DNA-binding NarL/FixJ family response regulator